MAEYYLISQLPSLDGIGESTPIPITEERLFELCNRFLNKKALKELSSLTLVPSPECEKTGSALIDTWYDNERDLRLVLCKVRAERMNKSFDLPKKSYSPELFKLANSAVEEENPLEAEKLLLHYRLGFLETLRPMDNFSDDYVFYYALRLKLIARIRQFDAALGETTYKNIYSSILNGEVGG